MADAMDLSLRFTPLAPERCRLEAASGADKLGPASETNAAALVTRTVGSRRAGKGSAFLRFDLLALL